MKKVLSIQSHVVSGYVGNRVAVYALQCFDFDVNFINTVQLSNHTGYPTFTGQVLKPLEILALYNGLEQNGLDYYDFLLTGYMGNFDTLDAVMTILEKLKRVNPNIVYVCDPVLGDNGALYPSMPKEIIPVYREKVIMNADYLLPNRTECELLTGLKIETIDDGYDAIVLLHERYMIEKVVITSLEVESDPGKIFVLGSEVVNGEHERFLLSIDKIDGHFTGTGDLFSSLLLARHEEPLKQAVQKILSTMVKLLQDTLSSPNRELALISNRAALINPEITVDFL